MYTPKHFVNDNPAEVKSFIRQNSFGILVSQAGGKLLATHIPLALSDDETKLTGHLSRANAQWKDFAQYDEVLAIFSGPHTYISSSWYNHENVPTWNYIAAHVYGKIQIINDDQLYDSLTRLVDKYEKHSVRPVTVANLSHDYMKRAMQGIVGFEILISKIESSFKLSQNRDQVNYNNIINELEKRGDEQSSQIASEMKNNHQSLFKNK
jgi:transcriptional regulator